MAVEAVGRIRSCNSASSASRATLAMIDAALIAGTVASPPITAVARQGPSGVKRPSTSSSPGGSGSASTARRIASRVAWWMFSTSISAALALPSAQPSASSRSTAASCSRRRADSRFESVRPAST
jgi:hypothetical protein